MSGYASDAEGGIRKKLLAAEAVSSGDDKTLMHRRGIDQPQPKNGEENLRQSEKLYRTIFETNGTATVVIEADMTVSLANGEMARLSGYAREEIEGRMKWPFLVAPEDQAVMRRYHQRRRDHQKQVPETYEFKLVTGNGEKRDVVATIAMIPETGQSVASLLDISQRKQAEEQLRYLSNHDALTGLYNRLYLEEQMQRLEHQDTGMIGLIVCDVDGLKIINDVMGHDKGDQMLRTVAGLLKSCFPDGDVVARVGGDEFAVLTARSAAGELEEKIRGIRGKLERYNVHHSEMPLSFSLGYALRSGNISMSSLFEQADSNMYREKLHSRLASRSAIIPIVIKALETRDYLDEGHGDRMENLVLKMARELDLPERIWRELGLLAQFHDIGKVGVPKSILFKNGRLNEDERIMMQRHCEIGNRIAGSTAELIFIADWILKHHEWWNGKGYPLGLEGEEIPLECRILAIADAYDAMSSTRPYHAARTRQEAVEELHRSAGIQFDPYLVEKFVHLL